MSLNILHKIFGNKEYLEYDIANKRIYEEKLPRRIHTVYLCLYNDVYNEYKRKKRFFSKDEWLYNRTMTKDQIEHERRRYEYVCTASFDEHYRIIK